MWRGWRAPRISTYHACGRCPVRPHHLRPLSTTASSGGAPSQGPAVSRSLTRTALGLALSGGLLGLGYLVGARSNSVGVEAFPSSPPKPVYGTPEEFARAIEELRTLFAGDAVTTAPDELTTHGFSPNSHFPGTPCS